MRQIKSQNRLSKILGSTILALVVTVIGLFWTIYSDKADDVYQATQQAKQDLQVELMNQSNQLQAKQLTAVVEQGEIEKQLLTSKSINEPNFAPTATALTLQSNQIKATRLALGNEQKQIEITQTAVSRPTATSLIVINADEIIPEIRGTDGELQRLLNWWREAESGQIPGVLAPSPTNPLERCFGLIWNTNEYGYHRLIVFQKPQQFTYGDGGWFVKICVPNDIAITPEDIGRIQAKWLEKRYDDQSIPWKVIIIQ